MEGLIYICSPYRAETLEQTQKHIEYAQELTRDTLLNGGVPVATHLYMTQCLDESDEKERKIGLDAGRRILLRCSRLIAGCKYGISEGMAAELKVANRYGIPIEYRDKEEQEGRDDGREDYRRTVDR